MRQEQIDHSVMVRHHRLRRAVIRIGTTVQKQPDHIDMALVGGPLQSRHAFDIFCVHGNACIQARIYDPDIASSTGIRVLPDFIAGRRVGYSGLQSEASNRPGTRSSVRARQ
jgi:hypothetical protein